MAITAVIRGILADTDVEAIVDMCGPEILAGATTVDIACREVSRGSGGDPGIQTALASVGTPQGAYASLWAPEGWYAQHGCDPGIGRDFLLPQLPRLTQSKELLWGVVIDGDERLSLHVDGTAGAGAVKQFTVTVHNGGRPYVKAIYELNMGAANNVATLISADGGNGAVLEVEDDRLDVTAFDRAAMIVTVLEGTADTAEVTLAAGLDASTDGDLPDRPAVSPDSVGTFLDRMRGINIEEVTHIIPKCLTADVGVVLRIELFVCAGGFHDGKAVRMPYICRCPGLPVIPPYKHEIVATGMSLDADHNGRWNDLVGNVTPPDYTNHVIAGENPGVDPAGTNVATGLAAGSDFTLNTYFEHFVVKVRA